MWYTETVLCCLFCSSSQTSYNPSYPLCLPCYFFFFQAEDGIRDGHVTGVQTCALPILHRRGDAWPIHRTVVWVCAAVVFGYLNLGGPAVYGHVLLSAHMLGHMAMVLIVPILIVLSAPVTLALRALPARRDGSRGPREWILLLVHSKWGNFWSHPIIAAGNLIASMLLFYFTPLIVFAMTTHIGHVLMVVHFTLVGYLFINVIIGIDPSANRPAYPMRLVLMFATMIFHAFFGVAIISMKGLIGAPFFGQLGLSWGVDAALDQRIAGEIT